MRTTLKPIEIPCITEKGNIILWPTTVNGYHCISDIQLPNATISNLTLTVPSLAKMAENAPINTQLKQALKEKLEKSESKLLSSEDLKPLSYLGEVALELSKQYPEVLETHKKELTSLFSNGQDIYVALETNNELSKILASFDKEFGLSTDTQSREEHPANAIADILASAEKTQNPTI